MRKKYFLSLGLLLVATNALAIDVDGRYKFCGDVMLQVAQAEENLLMKARDLCENPVLTTPLFHWADRGCIHYTNGWHVKADIICAVVQTQEGRHVNVETSIAVTDCVQALSYNDEESWEPEAFRPLWRALAETARHSCGGAPARVIPESIKTSCREGQLSAIGDYVCIE
jgi:hypothetical protein